MGKTRVFISSTCYDLSQIRKDLKESIEAMGHMPIMSENKDFPVNPMASTEDNCIEAVKSEADVFVLIIGNRYGYQLESGHSITNIEFLTAVQKEIPIYTFTLKSMIHVLPFWKKNPTSDFSEYVDDTKVFEFIEDVRSKRGLWNFEFDKAQDIIDILKSQLSILLSDALSECRELRSQVDKSLLGQLSGKALQLLLKKPDSYEQRLFMQMISDEIEKYSFAKNDCTYSIHIRKGESLQDIHSCLNWQTLQLSALQRSVDMLNNLLLAYESYIGPPGVPSDIKGLYYVAVRYGELYNYILNWVIDVKSADVCEECKSLNDILSRMPLKIISQLETFPTESLQTIERSLEDVAAGRLSKGAEVNLVLHVGLDPEIQKSFSNEIGRLKRVFIG